MIKTLTAALAALAIAAPASAAVRTIDFTIVQQNGWWQANGTEFPFGLTGDAPLTGQVTVDDALPGRPLNGISTAQITGLNYTTGGKTWTMADLSEVAFVSIKDDALEYLWLFLNPLNNNTIIWTPWGTTAGLDDGTNRVICSGCVSYVERIDGVIVSEGGPGIPTNAPGVPEPSTWAMMITGFGLAGASLRRRRASPAYA